MEDSTKIYKPSVRWGGVGTLSRTFYCYRKASARKRGIPFEVSIEQLWELLVQQQHQCALSGLPLTLDPRGDESYTNASVDRIDNTKGYVLGNLQWVHKDVNLMKMFLPQDRFLDLCSQITVYQGKEIPKNIDIQQTQRPRKSTQAKKPSRVTKPMSDPLTEENILIASDLFFQEFNEYPTCKDQRKVPGYPENSWTNYDSALRQGLRGLPGGSSLAQLLKTHRQVTGRQGKRRKFSPSSE